MVDFSVYRSPFEISTSEIPSANTIAPKTGFVFVTGNTPVEFIIPPIEAFHMIVFFWRDRPQPDPTILNTGNVRTEEDGITIVNPDTTLLFIYDPVERIYYGGIFDPEE